MKLGGDIAFRVPHLGKAVDIREVLAALLDHHDRLIKSMPSLKEPNFMDHILAGAEAAFGRLVFGRHHKKRHRGAVEHLSESGDSCVTGGRHPVEFVNRHTKLVLNVVLQLTPLVGTSVANEHAAAQLCSGSHRWASRPPAQMFCGIIGMIC